MKSFFGIIAGIVIGFSVLVWFLYTFWIIWDILTYDIQLGTFWSIILLLFPPTMIIVINVVPIYAIIEHGNFLPVILVYFPLIIIFLIIFFVGGIGSVISLVSRKFTKK